MKRTLQTIAAALLLSILNHLSSTVLAQGTTAFTYQGQLRDNGANANGAYTMIFNLYDSSSVGNLIGGPITTTANLANGLFTVNLDFGMGAFNGSARYLDITVTNGGETQELSPRVQVLSSPYALYAAVAATVTNGAIMNSQLAVNAVATTNIQNSAITTTQIAIGAVTSQNIAPNAVATTNIQDGAITDSKIAASTSLLSTYGSETNLRVVRGVLSVSSGAATNYAGSGFTVTFYPPGSGGTLFGSYVIYPDGDGAGDYVLKWDGGNTGQVNPYQWIVINNELFQVQSVVNDGSLSSTITTYGMGSGQFTEIEVVAAYMNSRLASEWDITFTPPFSGLPAIALSNFGNTAFSNNGSTRSVALKYSTGEVGGTNFTAIVSYNLVNQGGYPGGFPPYGDGFEFIAIGPK